jgi:hypothetical protein
MAEAGSLSLCIDECMGSKIARVLRELRAPGAPNIHGVGELELSGVSDQTLFAELHKRKFQAMVTKDSAILSASIRREAWEGTELVLFVLHGSWGNLPLFDQARRLLWWWPAIFQTATEAVGPAAWTVRRDMNGSLERKF